MKKNLFVVGIAMILTAVVPFSVTARTFFDAAQRDARNKMRTIPSEVKVYCEQKNTFVDRKARYVDYIGALDCANNLQEQRLASRPDININSATATSINYRR